MSHTHAKGQGQRSLGSNVRVETDGRTNGRTEAIALPDSLMRSVITPDHAGNCQGNVSDHETVQ